MCASPKRGHSQSKPFSFILCWSYWWWWLMLLRYLSLSNKIIVWTHQAEVLNDIQYCAKVLTYLTFLYILLPRSRSFFEIAFEPINRKQKKVWGLDWITSHNCTYYVTPFIFACFNKSFYLFPIFLVKYKEMKNLQTLCFPLCPPPHLLFPPAELLYSEAQCSFTVWSTAKAMFDRSSLQTKVWECVHSSGDALTKSLRF